MIYNESKEPGFAALDEAALPAGAAPKEIVGLPCNPGSSRVVLTFEADQEDFSNEIAWFVVRGGPLQHVALR